MNFTTFDFATFERHVFRKAFLKTTGKIWKRMISHVLMAKSKAVAILVATHFHCSISSAFIFFYFQMKRLCYCFNLCL